MSDNLLEDDAFGNTNSWEKQSMITALLPVGIAITGVIIILFKTYADQICQLRKKRSNPISLAASLTVLNRPDNQEGQDIIVSDDDSTDEEVY